MSAAYATPENIIQFPSKSREDVEILTAPFRADQHEFLKGMVYLREEAITDRLDIVDPSWQFTIMSVTTRPGTPHPVVTAVGNLTVKGVTQSGVGMAMVELNSDGNREAGEAEKAAATDALKRAARLHGVGRYLLSMPRKMDPNSISNVLWQMYPEGNPLNKYITLPGETDDAPPKPEPMAQPKARPQTTDGSSALDLAPEADADEQPEPVKPDLSMQKSVTITTVNIRTDKNGRPFMALTTMDGEVISEWSRRAFIEAHWIGEGDWNVTGETYGPYHIPAAIAKDDKGYWKIVHVTSAPDRETQREPKDVLGQGGNKGPIGRDNGEADDVPDNLPPAGVLPTAFRPETMPSSKPKFIDVTGMQLIKRGSGQAVVFFHNRADRTEISIAASKFEGLVSELEHARQYMLYFEGLKVLGPDHKAKPMSFKQSNMPDLMLEVSVTESGGMEVIKAYEAGDVPF